MSKRRKNQIIQCQYFSWKLRKNRYGVWFADGRSGNGGLKLGRPSLNTWDKTEALEALRQLDLVMAVRHGLADESVLNDRAARSLTLEKGRQAYLDHVGRAPSAGGASKATVRKYRPILRKFVEFARGKGLQYWEEVNDRLLAEYAGWLDEQRYAYRSQYSELTTIKQAVKCLIGFGLLPESARLRLHTPKPSDRTTIYCYADHEVAAIMSHCAARDDLRWLAEVITGLAYTGMRIGELAQLSWQHIDLDAGGTGFIWVVDTTRQAGRGDGPTFSTKTHASRKLPIHPALRPVLLGIRTRGRKDDGRIFHGPRGGVLKPDTVRVILKREVLEPLKEKFPSEPGQRGFADGRLHSFRHYFCSKCAREGVPELTLMEWLGHRSSHMVRHYYHLHDDEAERQMARLRPIRAAEPEGEADATS